MNKFNNKEYFMIKNSKKLITFSKCYLKVMKNQKNQLNKHKFNY